MYYQVRYDLERILPIPICFAFCCAASEAITAASRLSIGTECVPAIMSVFQVCKQAEVGIELKRGMVKLYNGCYMHDAGMYKVSQCEDG